MIKHFEFEETPIQQLTSFSDKMTNSFSIKRDDLFIHAGGGSKARKLQYILYKAKIESFDSVVTTGDINSNHNRATALMCAKLGMKLKLIIHNDFPDKERNSVNMFFSRITDAQIIYCSKASVASVMDQCMQDFVEDGYNPFYIWGGGHCLEGSYAYFDAVNRLNKTFDYIFFASGTGTTHAGLHLGFNYYYPGSKVVGISIARNKSRGIDQIYQSIIQLEDYLKMNQNTRRDSITFIDKYIGDGYESFDSNIICLIKRMINEEAIILDPTYTGKAYYGMLEYLRENKIEGQKILFWHTGGLFNLLSTRDSFL